MNIEKLSFRHKVENQALGFLGAAFMGIVVAAINSEHGLQPASIAAFKQFLYTFIAIQFTLPVHEAIFFRVKDCRTLIKETAPVLVPVIFTSALTFGVHSLKGTPEPVASTIPTLIAAPIAFTILHIKTRVQMNAEHTREPQEMN